MYCWKTTSPKLLHILAHVLREKLLLVPLLSVRTAAVLERELHTNTLLRLVCPQETLEITATQRAREKSLLYVS